MRHGYFGRKLKRNVGERRSLFKNLVRSLLSHGTIRTSLAKAKAVQPMVEKLITKAKDGSRASIAEISKTIADTKIEKILIDWAKSRFAARTSGYTRLTRIGRRQGDAGEEVYLSFVDELEKPKEVKKDVKSSKKLKLPK